MSYQQKWKPETVKCMFNVMRKKSSKIYPVKKDFNSKCKIKTFSDKIKFKNLPPLDHH